MLENAETIATQSRADRTPAKPRSRVEKRRYDGRSAQAVRVRSLIAGYVARLGVGADIERIRRAAELQVIAEELRAAALRNEPIDRAALFKAEGYADRAVRALGLDRQPEPKRSALTEYLARKQGADA